MNELNRRPLVVGDEPLAPRTTLGVGGAARWFAEARDVTDLLEALEWGREKGLSLFALGGGSNIVVSDDGFDGLVIDVALRGIECLECDGGVELTVNAGESWDDVVEYAVSRGLAGIECLAGIPGRVGATPIQNVGAYGQEVAETITKVELVSRASGERVTYSESDCGFGYRDSVFKRGERNSWIVTAVTFRLDRDRPAAIRYAELERRLSGVGSPSLVDVRRAVLELRRAKGMVLDATDTDTRSVGSFFTNPIVDDETMAYVVTCAEGLGIEAGSIPRFAVGDGASKLSAAWLIERAGYPRGLGRGAAGLSGKHALAIVNRGGATAQSIRALADEIADGVRQAFGVELQPEVAFIGWPDA